MGLADAKDSREDPLPSWPKLLQQTYETKKHLKANNFCKYCSWLFIWLQKDHTNTKNRMYQGIVV